MPTTDAQAVIDRQSTVSTNVLAARVLATVIGGTAFAAHAAYPTTQAYMLLDALIEAGFEVSRP